VSGLPPEPRAQRIANGLLVAAVLLGAAWTLAQLLHFRYGRDQGIYHMVAVEMLDGGAPYRDAWDFKPPGIFLVFVLARLFGSSDTAIRIVEALGWASLIYAYALLTRRHVGSWLGGLVGGALACLIHVELEFWNTGQPESFAAVALAWALVCATYEARPDDPRGERKQLAAWLGAGALYGVAFLMKPPLAGGIVVTWAIVVRRLGLARWRRPTAALVAGAAAPIVLTLLYFALHGALGDLYDTLAVFTPKYTAIDFRWGKLHEHFIHAFADWLVAYSGVMALGIGLALALPPAGPRDRELVVHLLGAAFFPVLGVALQAKFFGYHFDTALSLGAAVAGLGLWKLWTQLRGRWLALAPVYAALVLALILGRTATKGPPGDFWERSAKRREWLGADPQRRRALEDALYNVSGFEPVLNREAALWLRDHSRPGEPVLVFGFEPTMYAIADRPPATRYFYNVAQRVDWASPSYRRRFLDDLTRRPPAAIAVETQDRFPWVIGNRRSSAETLAVFPELSALLAARYDKAGGNPRFDLYVRRSSGTSGI